MELQNYPKMRDGLYYVIAMGCGDGETFTGDVVDYVKKDIKRLEDDGNDMTDITPIDHVDLLSVFDEKDNEVAYFNFHSGWIETEAPVWKA